MNDKNIMFQYYKTATIFDPPYCYGGGNCPSNVIKSVLLSFGWWNHYLIKHEIIDGDDNNTILSINEIKKVSE